MFVGKDTFPVYLPYLMKTSLETGSMAVLIDINTSRDAMTHRRANHRMTR